MERKKTKKGKNVSVDMERLLPIESKDSNLKGDRKNIALLFFLYTLQGIPIGLSAAIPMILQNRGVSYRQQAEFSFVTWPFSLKLMWAPIVDAIYSSKVGRRKSWMVPTQYLIGAFMLLLSFHVNDWLGSETIPPNIGILTALFFSLNFLAATQDIAVDGWALTMLKKENIGHASTCNSVGQTTGFFLSYVLFMALESADFCNNYLRSVPDKEGIITLAGFLNFWGWIFIISTTLVGIFKKEEIHLDSEDHDSDVKSAYTSLLQILKLKPVQLLVIILLTCKIGFAATDSILTLKLVEVGVPKEQLGLMAIPLIPLQIALPLVIAKYTTGPRPLDVFKRAIPYRLVFGFVAAWLLWITPSFIPNPSSGIPIFYYILLLVCYSYHQVCLYSMFVSCMAFFAKVSDPVVGGTYMTLLNTVTNLGGNWPATLALYFVETVTFKECMGAKNVTNNECRTKAEEKICLDGDGKCAISIDGFYIETIICVSIGCLWLLWAQNKIHKVQSMDEKEWRLVKRTK